MSPLGWSAAEVIGFDAAVNPARPVEASKDVAFVCCTCNVPFACCALMSWLQTSAPIDCQIAGSSEECMVLLQCVTCCNPTFPTLSQRVDILYVQLHSDQADHSTCTYWRLSFP